MILLFLCLAFAPKETRKRPHAVPSLGQSKFSKSKDFSFFELIDWTVTESFKKPPPSFLLQLRENDDFLDMEIPVNFFINDYNLSPEDIIKFAFKTENGELKYDKPFIFQNSNSQRISMISQSYI